MNSYTNPNLSLYARSFSPKSTQLFELRGKLDEANQVLLTLTKALDPKPHSFNTNDRHPHKLSAASGLSVINDLNIKIANLTTKIERLEKEIENEAKKNEAE